MGSSGIPELYNSGIIPEVRLKADLIPLLSFLSHSTAAKKNEVPGGVFSVCVQPGAQHLGIVCDLALAASTADV